MIALPRFRAGERGLTSFSASVMNRIVDRVNALWAMRVVRGQADGVYPSEDNFLIQLAKNAAAGPTTTTGATVTQYKLKKIFGNYLQCVSAADEAAWTGTTTGAEKIAQLVNVARPPLLCNSVTSRTLDGVAITYNYTTGITAGYETVERTAAASGFNTETQRVIPHYIAAGLSAGVPNAGGDDIYAASCSLIIASVSFAWIDLNVDGRYWSQVPVAPPP